MVLQANQLLPHQTGKTFSLWILFTEALQTCQHDIKVCWYVLSLQSMQKNCLLMWLLMPWPCYTTFCLVIRNLAVSHTQDKTRERRSPSSHVALLLMFGENQVTKRKCRKSGCIRKCLLVLGVQQGIVLTNTEQLLCLWSDRNYIIVGISNTYLAC